MCDASRYTNVDWKIYQYLRLHIKIICQRFHIITCVLTKMRNDLKPPNTNRNHLETTLNRLKPHEISHIIVFLLKISYSQVAFVLVLQPKVFWGKFGPKNWSSSNWLKFGIGVNCYILMSNLKFVFKIFVIHIWSQNLKSSKLSEIWYRGTLLYAYYNFNVYFFKILFVDIFFWEIWS